jgi:acyl-CoA reductase-like NAD-dependent aldehyde dehydrogenase
MILATGGSGMVKSAYSAGKPALGVGPGNVPCYIHKDVDLERACTDLIISKTFDNGMICASEQAVIVDKEISGQFEEFMKKYKCYFLSADETQKVTLEAARAAATKYAKPASASVLLVGDRAKIEAGLRETNLGEIVVLDSEGRPLASRGGGGSR